MSVPMDNNVSTKEHYKISKYKDVEIEIKKKWHVKTIIVPVIVWALNMNKNRTVKLAVPFYMKYKNKSCFLWNYLSTRESIIKGIEKISCKRCKINWKFIQ